VELGDAAIQLAAEAAAARALDSGPLTPPPTLDDPGPTPPPVAALPSPPTSVDEPSFEEAPTPPPIVAPVVDTELGARRPDAGAEESASLSRAEVPLPEEALADATPAAVPPTEVDGAADASFTAHETPWPELGQQAAVARVATPTPGAIPTDAMGGDGSGRSRELPPETQPLDDDRSDARKSSDDGDVSVVDALEVDDGAESLDALPPEALADATTEPIAVSSPPAPPPRATAAPPPIPAGPARRKTGELRAPEVPTAQVLASIVPSIPSGVAALPEALAQRPRRPKRSKPWFEEVFDEDYLRTLPFMSADQTLREVEFIESSLGVKPGGQILDVGCGYGRHAIELVQRGLDVTGLDLSLPLLLRAADEAQKRAMSVNFVHADMREMAFDKQFDGACSMLTSFGYFDEETNLRVAEGIARALKPGGRLLLDLVNRDYVVGDLPSRVWWEGNGCVVLEEVDFNFHTSRIITHRSIVFEDGRQVEQEISVRAYSLHEIGRLLRQAGFRVIDISGGLATRGHFFGGTSRNLLILAEKRTDET
ncbi:MAG TPA: methyltransferase domain-containing protein, partial [Polyangia bacterium]|nr:methyltransferase domain-containing protein [Polyangia bacterium]